MWDEESNESWVVPVMADGVPEAGCVLLHLDLELSRVSEGQWVPDTASQTRYFNIFHGEVNFLIFLVGWIEIFDQAKLSPFSRGYICHSSSVSPFKTHGPGVRLLQRSMHGMAINGCTADGLKKQKFIQLKQRWGFLKSWDFRIYWDLLGFNGIQWDF